MIYIEKCILYSTVQEDERHKEEISVNKTNIQCYCELLIFLKVGLNFV